MARKEKIFHYIYKTTNLLNEKYYYGMHSTNNLEDGYLGSGKRLRYSINKHGAENHSVEILEYLPNRKELAKREKEIVNLNEIAKENCMNLMVGGEGGFISVEQQHNRAICAGNAFALKLKNNAEYLKIHNERASKTMKENHRLGKITYGTFLNKKHSDGTKILMSIKAHERIGEKNSQFGTCWITKDGINKKIQKDSLNTYIQDNWIRGRVLK